MPAFKKEDLCVLLHHLFQELPPFTQRSLLHVVIEKIPSRILAVQLARKKFPRDHEKADEEAISIDTEIWTAVFKGLKQMRRGLSKAGWTADDVEFL
ncbi:MAG: hypothetical protein V2A78_02050 [bacterium]